MCGISGIIKFEEQVVIEEDLRAMGAELHHRGPDYLGIENLGRIGLVHNRLSIIDLSPAGNQPFTDGKHYLVFNGEIYNFNEIRKDLEPYFEFKGHSDTEVLFYSIIKFGIENTLSKLVGMFAFAFYNGDSKDFYLARDRFGIKPLYFYRDSKEFLFSSEVKAIWKVRNIRLDRIKTMFSFYGSGETNINNTLFQGVYPLKPGHYIHIDSKNQLKENTYFDLFDFISPEQYIENSKKSRKTIEAEFSDLFDESVRALMVSDAPVGVFQSGGIDSSLVSAVSYKYAKPQLFSAKVVDYNSESEKAKEMADFLKAEILFSDFKNSDYSQQIAGVTKHYETPIISFVNSLPMANVAALARENGVKVVLTGEGSDELFLGYPLIIFRKFKQKALLPYRFLKKIYNLIPGLSGIIPSDTYLDPKEIIRLMDMDFYRQEQRKFFKSNFNFVQGNEQEMLYATIFMFRELLIGLLHRNDRMGMKHSIEARFPFLYDPLVKFAMNVPVKYKYQFQPRIHDPKHPFLFDKSIVRNVAKGIVPRNIIEGKKWGFGTNVTKKSKYNPEFFKNGFVQESLRMSDRGIKFMIDEMDSYTIGKIAAIEIFGRIYEYKESCEIVTERVSNNLSFE